MEKEIAHIFSASRDVDAFKESVISLQGDFDFSSGSMIELGTVYFNRYPDRFSNRNTEEVLLGYAVVRICIVEKLLYGISGDRKNLYRELFSDVSAAERVVKGLIGLAGNDAVLKEYVSLSSGLQRIKETIDEIPRGMIKERFIGGISNLFNILYVLKMTIGKLTGA
ncbi:MAG: hypothetical protein JXA20_02670 [Spirochaetes bacterium]|nr:hypothetical protein [Spirochaetota bacterium]